MNREPGEKQVQKAPRGHRVNKGLEDPVASQVREVHKARSGL